TLARRARGGKPNGPGWRVRIVPNKYPVLCPTREIFYSPKGLHEIIVESPKHLTSITQLNDDEFTEVLEVYHERIAMLRDRFHNAILLKNSALLGGATLSHVHSQLLAGGAMGPQAANFENYPKMHGVCPLCEWIGGEISIGRRVVLQTKRFLAFCPFA